MWNVNSRGGISTCQIALPEPRTSGTCDLCNFRITAQGFLKWKCWRKDSQKFSNHNHNHAPVDEHGDTDGADSLGGGEHLRERVFLVGDLRLMVRVACGREGNMGESRSSGRAEY